MLELEDVHVYYGSIQALDGISLQVQDGELVTIVGSNGAGKSTTLMTISGVTWPATGRVLVDGEDITRSAPHHIVAHGDRPLSGRQAHLWPLDRGRKPDPRLLSPSRPRAVNDDLDRMYTLFPRLLERRRQLAGTLSGGEQQMLALGRALMGRPRLLMLDEPSLGLAPLLVDRIFEVIGELHRQGVTILLVGAERVSGAARCRPRLCSRNRPYPAIRPRSRSHR